MNHIRHFIKIPFINKGIDSSIYLAYLEIIQLNRLFLIILKIKNRLLFVINKINLLEVQYLISINQNWLLILILIQRLQIHEIVKIQNFCYELAGHIITGNLKIISDSRIRSIISKGPKYRLPSQIDFNK